MTEWPRVRLGDICEVNIGRTPARNRQEFWGPGHRWVSIADMNQGRDIFTSKETITEVAVRGCNCKPVPPSTVLLSFKLSIGKVSVTRIPVFTNEAIAALPIRDKDRLLSAYLYWALKSIDLTAGLDRAAKGLTLNKAKLLGIALPLPPISEQRRIVAILDKADEMRAKRRAALAQLSGLTQAILLHRFGDLSSGSTTVPMVHLSSVSKRITDGTHQPPEWVADGIPFLFVSNVVDGRLDFHTQRFISDATHAELTRRCPIDVGDVLYTTVGSYGNAALVTTSRKFAFQRHIAHIKPDPHKMNSAFLAAMLQSASVRRQADRVARGVAQKTVNLSELSKFLVFQPSLDEQRRFARTLQPIEELKRLHERSEASIDALFAALQQRAFTGAL